MASPTRFCVPPCSRKICRQGFSFVELVVVIAILSLLAALVLPAFTHGHEQARRVQCLGQLQEWGRALHLYADDNSDATPRRGQGVRPLTKLDRPEDWFNALAPELNVQTFGNYIASAGTNTSSPPTAFVCPEAKPASHRYFLTYAMNMYLSPWSLPEPHHLTKIPAPSIVVFMADGGVGYCSAFPAAAEYSPQARHLSTANLVFADGHVASFKSDDLGCDTGINKRADVMWRFDTNVPPFAP